MAPKRKRRSRRRLIVGVLLFLFIVMAGGSVYVYMRGRDRASVYEKAMQAWGNGNVDEAEEGLRTVLTSNSAHHQAREALIKLLMDEKAGHGTAADLEEADGLARVWTENERTARYGWEYLIELSLRRFRFTEAERIARSISDEAPELSLRTIIRVRDSLGTNRDRWEAQKAAASLAAITASDANRAQMFLYAAETLVDLTPARKEDESPTEARQRAAIDREMRRYLAESRRALEGALVTGLDDKTSSNWAARMRLLSLDSRERAQGAAALRTMLEEVPVNHWSREALIRHLVRAEQLDDKGASEGGWGAVSHVRALDRESAPFPVWMRCILRIARADRRADAMALIGESRFSGNSIVELRRAQILFLDDPDAALALVLDLVRGKDLDQSVLITMYEWLAAQEDLRVYGAQLLRAVESEGDVEVRATLARSLAGGVEAERAEAFALIDDLAGGVETFAESLRILRMLQGGGPEAVQRFVDAVAAKDNENREKYVLIRAFAYTELWRRAQDDSAGARWRELAVQDLESFDVTGTAKADLIAGWKLALSIAAHDLAGRLLGRAISLPGPPHDLAYSCVRMARRTADEAVCAEVAAGLERAAQSGLARPLLEQLGEAIVTKPFELKALAARLETILGDEAVATPALFLAVSLAEERSDREAASRYAEQLHRMLPESAEARDAWARQLLLSDRYDEANALYANAPIRNFGELQLRASALLGLRRQADAIILARDYIRVRPRDPRSHLLLADLYYKDGRRDEAMGVLAAAPSSRDVEFQRAMLLLEQNDLGLAEMVFLKMLDRNVADLAAWRGLFTALRREGRTREFDEHVSSVIPSKMPDEPNAALAVLLTMRASARSDLSEFGAAMTDYRQAIELNPDYVPALNNLAVLLARYFASQPERLDEARKHVDAAREIAPNNADVLDTSAMVYGGLGQTDEAVQFSDAALASLYQSAKAAGRGPAESKEVTYLLTKAGVLEGADRTDAAIEVLRRVLEVSEAVDTDQTKAVSRRLRELERRAAARRR